MKDVLIIGSGIAGLSAAIEAAEKDMHAILVSPRPSEQSQSVMASGGINAALGANDSFEKHFEDTYKSGGCLENKDDVLAMCKAAPDIIKWLCSVGTLFTRNEDESLSQRAFGGQSENRTCYCGASTGKHIMTALIQKCREYEISGKIERITSLYFTELIIKDGICFGAAFVNEAGKSSKEIYADYTLVCTGGLNGMLGKTTGSRLNDAYAAAKMFMQGVRMRNLEFVQYHPTCIDAQGKKIMISEAARGEGGRLYYLDGDKKVYFMEDTFGPKGNLMPRDVVCEYMRKAPSQVYLDISFLDKDVLSKKLLEVCEICKRYLKLDPSKESIPVSPAPHFFMGGLYVDSNHETNIKNLFAAGECASKYHGKNRLGGNSLLAGIYGGKLAADVISKREDAESKVACGSFDSDKALSAAYKKETLEVLTKAYEMSLAERKDLSQGESFAEYKDGNVVITFSAKEGGVQC